MLDDISTSLFSGITSPLIDQVGILSNYLITYITYDVLSTLQYFNIRYLRCLDKGRRGAVWPWKLNSSL